MILLLLIFFFQDTSTTETNTNCHPLSLHDALPISQRKGKALVFGYLATTDLSTIGMYAPEDPRVALMGDFGLVNAPIVAKSVKDGEFYGDRKSTRLNSSH